MTTMFLGTPVWFWASFVGIVLTILALDLGILNRRDHEIGYRESLRMSAVYVSIALLFGLWVLFQHGRESGLDYYTAYVIEYSLSMDNIFMMAVIFSYFGIPREYQHRVLFWGVIGVLVLRGLMITVGTALIQHFDWILLFFGAFLIYGGIKMLLSGEDEAGSMENSRIVRTLEKHLRITRMITSRKFFIRLPSPKDQRMVYYATPLFLALVTIELVDVIFAVDSIPAVFAVTSDSFVVFSSNIFAVLGLRTLYFLLAAMVNQFRYLPPAVAIVLVFIGGKVFYAELFGQKVDSLLSLAITLTVLGGGLLLSVVKKEKAGESG